MPNWTDNTVEIWGSSEVLNKLKDLFGSEESVFDFQKIIPMPANIFRGNLGEKERKEHGENNWYDWGRANWGTKWNSVESKLVEIPEQDLIVYSFLTAWDAPRPLAQFIYDNHLNEVDWCNWYCTHEFEENTELLIGDKEEFFGT